MDEDDLKRGGSEMLETGDAYSQREMTHAIGKIGHKVIDGYISGLQFVVEPVSRI
jgi:hypothetical protein